MMSRNKKGSLLQTVLNKIVMRLSGIIYGQGFCSYGKVIFRNYAGKNHIKFGNNVQINSFNGGANPGFMAARSMFIASNNGDITVGDNVKISNSVLFSANSITIGHNTVINSGCKIFDTDFHSSNPQYRLNGNTHVPTKPVKIGENVFIGMNVTVLKGTTIEDGAVIGAGSVVTKDIPSNEVWAGNPAHFIKKL